MKGLRRKAEITVGTETTRWVSDRSKLLMGSKRPVTDVLAVRIENLFAPETSFCGSVCSARLELILARPSESESE